MFVRAGCGAGGVEIISGRGVGQGREVVGCVTGRDDGDVVVGWIAGDGVLDVGWLVLLVVGRYGVRVYIVACGDMCLRSVFRRWLQAEFVRIRSCVVGAGLAGKPHESVSNA